jgi:hypothetical protein
MSICQSVREFDSTYHRLIQSISREDQGEIKAAYQIWMLAQFRLADHQRKASECADLATVQALDTLIQESCQALSGNGERFLEEYPKYVAAREEVAKLTHADLMALLAEGGEYIPARSFFVSHAGFDIKSFLDGLVRKI